jgi:putative ABC transport system permease protein
LWESVILTGIGGVIGILIGVFLNAVIYFVLVYAVKTDWVFSLPPDAIIIALLVSSLTGVVFGIYPAREAARKSPIESLRYE